MKNLLWIWFLIYSVLQSGILIQSSENVPEDIICVQEYHSHGEFQAPENSSTLKLSEQEEDDDESGSSGKSLLNNVQESANYGFGISPHFPKKYISKRRGKIYLLNLVLII